MSSKNLEQEKNLFVMYIVLTFLCIFTAGLLLVHNWVFCIVLSGAGMVNFYLALEVISDSLDSVIKGSD